MKTYQVRRAAVSLGLFNERELRALLQKGKLLATDEIDEGSGKWGQLGAFMATLPAPMPTPAQAPARPVPVSAVPGRNFYLHAGGQRIGPLERSKIVGMAQSGLVDPSAMLEDVALPGRLDPIADHVTLPTLTPSYATASAATGTVPSVAPSPVVAVPPPIPPKPVAKNVSYLDLWVKATLWIYGLGALFGYLAGNMDGFLAALVVGILLAPLKGAFWAWIIWLFKK
jgi:hypothetical protein